ncbi:hypothetical protein FHS85_005236 [Rhodoligotrophos appendicifer]|uniref:DUF2285 domain-containing protein n=1 Tax=Rhodoligotrophos appendicifer TaxID=987056 RepID=UPI001FE73330|nr:DUF2285 domain-containing protein [Rhodoligotrophos appendicifer]
MGASPKSQSDLRETIRRDAPEGTHLQLAMLSPAIHVIVLASPKVGQPLAAIVPLDADGLDRIAAVDRLWRSLHHLPVPVDVRLTQQQRRRLKLMLRAADGRMNHATYREIADAIFGAARVADDPWKTSALRDATRDLVRDGLAMIAGGYLKLLRHRRRS